mmetsp:Transcript_10948/g.26363  ORF Transcript_10948/g.26363 Transcript_10948/m.26363 type:complete len:226 (+) Transcript_10948:428-1105(+)
MQPSDHVVRLAASNVKFDHPTCVSAGEEGDRWKAGHRSPERAQIIACAVHLSDDHSRDVGETSSQLLVLRLEVLAVATPRRIAVDKYILSRILHRAADGRPNQVPHKSSVEGLRRGLGLAPHANQPAQPRTSWSKMRVGLDLLVFLVRCCLIFDRGHNALFRQPHAVAMAPATTMSIGTSSAALGAVTPAIDQPVSAQDTFFAGPPAVPVAEARCILSRLRLDAT